MKGRVRLTKKSTMNSFKKTRPIEAPAAGKMATTPAGLKQHVSAFNHLRSPLPDHTYPEGEKI